MDTEKPPQINPDDDMGGSYLVFNHYETLTIQKEVFEEGEGSFSLYIAGITYYGGICVVGMGGITLSYEYINENTVRLFMEDK